MNCPHCNKPIPPRLAAAVMGAKGGKVRGPSKARTSAQARNAVLARWAKAREAAGSITVRSPRKKPV